MKWVKSATLALATLFAVSAVALFSLVKANVVFSDAAASPVYENTQFSSLPIDVDAFKALADTLAQKQVIVSNTPNALKPGVTFTVTTDDDKDLLLASTMLQQEFIKYTAQTMQSSGLKKIYLVKNLTVNGQARSGMPEPLYEDALYFDVANKYISSENGAYIRRTFHHEFKHLMDYNLSGSYQGNIDEWTKCNASGYTYGNGGPSMYADANFAHKFHPENGFITGYATSGIDEDRAETYAWYMTSPQVVSSLQNADSNFSCKVAILKNVLNNL